MDENGFCLKWEKFIEVCKGTFSQLLGNEQFADVTLFCEGTLIRCHRLILSASSQYFQNLLTDLNQPNPVIAMHNVKLQDLTAIITFVYTGQVTVAQEQLASLVKLGEILKVKGLGENDEQAGVNEAPVPKKSRVPSYVDGKDSEGLTAKRRKCDNGNEVTQLRQEITGDVRRVAEEETVVECYDTCAPVLVKEEETELVDLEADPTESMLEDVKDSDFTNFEDPDVTGLSADYNDSHNDESADPGEGTSFSVNSQEHQIEDDVRGLIARYQRDGVRLKVEELLKISPKFCCLCKLKLHNYSLRRMDHFIVHHSAIIEPIKWPCKICGNISLSFNSHWHHCKTKHKVNYSNRTAAHEDL